MNDEPGFEDGLYFRHCRVCGLRITSEDPDQLPWGRDGKSPGWSACPCCATEDGFEDVTPDTARTMREIWLAKGAPWFKGKRRPPGWDLEAQLANVPAEYR